jgi:hypothetical protein
MGYDKDGRLLFTPDYTHWLKNHQEEMERYLYYCIGEHSRPYISSIFRESPHLAKIVIEDFLVNSENANTLRYKTLDYLLQEGHELSAISGSRGSGKTSLSVSIIEEATKIDDSIQKVYVGAPNRELELHGWETVPSIDSMKKGDMGAHDEMAIFVGSRRSMSGYNVEFLEQLPTVRHKEIKGIIVITQSTKRMDVGVLDYVNAHIIKTYSDAFSLDVERSFMKDDLIYEFLLPRPNYVFPSHIKEWSFVKTGAFMNLVYSPMVSWYSDKVGKAFNSFDGDKDALEWATAMFQDDNYDPTFMMKYMKNRGFKRDIDFWKEMKINVMDYTLLPGLELQNIAENQKDVKEIKPLIEEDSEDIEERRRNAMERLKKA